MIPALKRRSLGITTLVATALLQGCTAVQSAQWATSRYCAQPEPARSALREAVAVALAPNRLRVDCAEDQQ